MVYLRTEAVDMSEAEILEAIEQYESEIVPDLTDLWRYYRAKNPTITERKAPDENNPDNKTVVSYGRKLVKTFTGYAYRPGYISYKSSNEAFAAELQRTFRVSSEPVRTSRTGRNTGIYGVAYELLYIDSTEQNGRRLGEPRFINVDPREMIVYHDFAPDPDIVLAIRFYPVTEDYHKVEFYTASETRFYNRTKNGSGDWELTQTGVAPNYFGEVQVVEFFLGDERIGIIEPVRSLIDDLDLITSDAMNEFDRFSNAYLILKRMSITPPTKGDAESYSRALRFLKRRRVFENVPADGDVKFLLKDTPTDFIEWLADFIKEEIHKQSHVPDFMSERFGGDVSGAAIARMMFDFENLCSAAEGDFNLGLYERLKLIGRIYELTGRGFGGEYDDITITHKRNVPENIKEFAETAVLLKNAGFSSWLIADAMPNDLIPDVELELQRQREEREQMFMDMPMLQQPEQEAEDEEAEEEDAET